MHKDWVVGTFVSLIESQLNVFERGNPVLFDKPVERALVHTCEARAIRIVQWRTPRAPKWYGP